MWPGAIELAVAGVALHGFQMSFVAEKNGPGLFYPESHFLDLMTVAAVLNAEGLLARVALAA
jgi:hypothetical protein